MYPPPPPPCSRRDAPGCGGLPLRRGEADRLRSLLSRGVPFRTSQLANLCCADANENQTVSNQGTKNLLRCPSSSSPNCRLGGLSSIVAGSSSSLRRLVLSLSSRPCQPPRSLRGGLAPPSRSSPRPGWWPPLSRSLDLGRWSLSRRSRDRERYRLAPSSFLSRSSRLPPPSRSL